MEVSGETGAVEALLVHSRPWHKVQINIHYGNCSNTASASSIPPHSLTSQGFHVIFDLQCRP